MVKVGMTVAVLLAAAALAGCQTAAVEEAASPPGEAATGDWDHRLAPHAAGQPADEVADQVARRPGPADGPPEVDADPDRLMGLVGSRVGELLGPPAQLRREPPAEVWQYRAGDCVLDLFLYEEADALRVVHLEARDQTTAPADAQACLQELLRRRLAGQVS